MGSYPSRHCNSDLFLTKTGIRHLSLQLLEFEAYPSKYRNSPISAETVTCDFPSFSAVAPSDVGSFLGEQSVKFFQQYVWQFQRGLFRDNPTSTSTGCCSSFLAGSVTETSFLCTYLVIGIPMVPHASQPPFPALLAPSSFDSYLVPSTSSPTLAPSVGKAFIVGPGYGLIPGKSGGQNHQWHYLLSLPKKGY